MASQNCVCKHFARCLACLCVDGKICQIFIFCSWKARNSVWDMKASPDPIRWIIVQRMLFKYCDFQLKHWRGKMFYFLPIKAENPCYIIKIKNLSNFRYFIKQICEEIRYFSCDENLSVKLKHFEKSSNPDVIETVE